MKRNIGKAKCSESLHLLRGDEAELHIDLSSGAIVSAAKSGGADDIFKILRGGIPSYSGQIRIYDELDDAWYSDSECLCKTDLLKTAPSHASFRKQYKSAPFVLFITISYEKGFFKWRVEAEKLSSKVPDRSLRVYYKMPAIPGWHIWAPCKGGEKIVFDGLTTFNFEYSQNSWVSDTDIILPMMSHFSPELDFGFSMLNPIHERIPASRFFYSNAEKGFNWGSMVKNPARSPHLEACNYYIGLVGKRRLATELDLCFHEGCWRPALKKVFSRWNEYFVPNNDKINDDDGVFHCHGIGNMDVQTFAKSHLKFVEVHEHFEFYGEYHHGTKKKWFRNQHREALWRVFGGNSKSGKNDSEIDEWVKSKSDREIAAEIIKDKRFQKHPDYFFCSYSGRTLPPDVSKWSNAEVDEFLYHTKERISKVLDLMKKLGMRPYWYFNYTDGTRKLMDAKFSDSRTQGEKGEFLSSGWMMCHNMNSDPKFSFGASLIKESDRILRDYPQLDGFFLDCFRHYEIDFAHDDGVTVVNNKPAYSMIFSYDEVNEIVKKKLLKKKLCSFANKPQTIRMMRWVDGMMLEGSGDQFEEKYYWSAVAKPIVFLWGDTGTPDDENYRRSVLHGCYPKMVARTAKDIALLERYMPLFAQFNRRVICFDPDPIRAPKGSRTKIYTVGSDYLASIVNTDIDGDCVVKHKNPPYAVFRVKRACDVSKVGIMYPGDKEYSFPETKFDGAFIYVPMEKYTNCAVIRLFVTKNTGKKPERKLFKSSSSCCPDPESAFTSLAEL